MDPEYLEMLEDKFPETFDEILRLAIATKLNVQNLAQVFDLDASEALGILGAASFMLGSEHVSNSVDEVQTLLGDLEDDFDEDDDEEDERRS